MKQRTLLAALALLTLAQPARAQTESDDTAAKASISQATQLIREHKAQEALAMLEPAVAVANDSVAKAREDGLAFCASDITLAVLYSAMGAKENKPSVVFGPEVCSAYFLEAYVLTELGRRDEAIGELQILRGLSPMDAQYASELAFAYIKTGRISEAEAAYQNALDYAEFFGDKDKARHYRAAALRGLGYVAIDKNDFDAAEDFYKRSLKIEPDNPVAKSELEYIRQHRAN
ncbi:hypothetical protein GCM10011349_14510 [Novosphingobium indicum]|uniref:Tetratricopeptide repeat protein n=1 Tax=Novosphingobium indicum TaxID=462949 RepID=A0ABQ2JG47_9SPHN|nr:tetratricopeptide repeat protein [Novosphingobium indicum]GGN46862.1 hypothetical protein GCM10011349_14510 [Novosphingobium indicum]